MKQCMDTDNLHRRLKKIIGQVQAIDRMIDEDIPCEDVLSQINAAKSALHGCGKVWKDISSIASAMALNFLAIVLAITGILNPVVGALVHNAGSVLVIINSALLLKWK